MKKKIIIAAVITVIVIAAIILLLPKDPDCTGTVLTVEVIVIDAENDKENVIVSFEDEDGNTVYVRVTDKTAVVNADGKRFPADSLIKGDVISVWIGDRSLKVFEAKKIVFQYNKASK